MSEKQQVIPQTPKRILIFNDVRRFVGVMHSIASIERFGFRAAGLSAACKGKLVSYKGFYFRELPENVTLDLLNDLGNLKLEEFDQAIGIKRKYHKATIIRKQNSKYVQSQIKSRKKKDGENEC